MAPGATLATIFLTMSLVSLAGGMTRIEKFGIPIWLFILFFIMFRIKMYLDDILYFKEANTKTWQFKFGFILGIFSWFFWLASAVYLNDLHKAFFFVLLAFILSTIWVIREGIAKRFRNKHTTFLIANLFYMLFVFLALIEKLSLCSSLVILLIICIIDVWRAESLKALEEK